MISNTIAMKRISSHLQFGKKIFYSMIGVLLVCSSGYAQSSVIPDIALTDVSTSQEVKLSDFGSQKAVVVIFMCNSCPYSNYYVERIINLTKDFSSVGFLLINSSPDKFAEKESIDNMVEFVKYNHIPIPYLADKNQQALHSFKATKCPEVFVLKSSGKNFVVQYQGAIDDNPQVASDVKSFFLKDAIEKVLSGESPANSYIRPNGCMIKRN
jgi:peroxiredoxin